MMRLWGLVAVCLLSGMLVAVAQEPEPPNQQGTPGAGDGTTVAIVAFINLGDDPADDWIGDGIGATLAVGLGATVRVQSAVEAEQRGVSRLVEGTYQRFGDRLRVTALLVDLPSGRVLRPALVDGPMDELFALQDDLLAQLTGTATPARMTATPDRARTPQAEGPALPPPAGPAPTSTGAAGFAAPSVMGTVIDGPPAPVPPEIVARDAQGRVTMRATRLTEGIDLDGRLEEAVYGRVAAVTDFVQQLPNEGAPATEATEAWIFFDDDTVYISARCWDSQPDRMVANEMRRDNIGIFENENFAVVFDTYYDRRNGYMFHVNPLAGMFDGHITDEGSMNRDWNAVWSVQTARFEGGWTVEMAIPFSSVRFRSGTTQTWGVNLRRIVQWKNETSYLTPVPAATGRAGIMRISSGGTLVGIEVPSERRNLEVKPYLIGDVSTDRAAIPPTSNDPGGDFGFDVKYGVTQGLTADFTYNTDFAQVEVDEQQVNLTRFSLFFPEKREFFLEGRGIFDFGGGGGFGGRGPGLRVGSAGGGGSNTPILFFSRRIGLEDGVEVPILAGGRLTGKAGAFSIGLLSIQTDDEPAADALSTNFSVVRLQRDILRRSSIGVLGTYRSVSLVGDGSNQTYGADGAFRFYDNVEINTYIARTDTPGLDGNNLSYRGQFDYNGDKYGLQAERLVVDENFNPEVGFLRRTDFQRSFGSARYSPRPAGIAAIRRFSWSGNFDYITNGTGRVETRIAAGQFGVELENSDQFLVEYADNYEFLDEPFEVSPGVVIPVGEYRFGDTRALYGFGRQRPLSGTVTASYGGFFGGEKTSVGVSRSRVELTPQFSIEPGLSLNWVDVPDGSFTTTLGTGRFTYTATPRAFVSALVQYNSSGNSLSTNIRLRWEYQPGSELFVVYTDERDTFGPHAPTLENRAFVVKVTKLFRF